MSEYNSALGYSSSPSVQDLQDALGIAQFSGAAGENWFIVLNGLIIQGGSVEITGVGPAAPTSFVTAFPQQVLGIFAQGVGALPLDFTLWPVSLTGFTLNNVTVNAGTAYWWAIGV